MDCGFEYGKVQGLFSKSDRRRGIVRSKPLDLRWTAQIRIGEGEERPALEIEPSTAMDMAGGEDFVGEA